MTKRAKILTILASAALMTAAVPAMAQSVDSTTSVGVTASASSGDLLSSLLGDLGGLIGNLGLGGLL